MRYSYDGTKTVDGLNGGEGAFLACSLWLADCLYTFGRVAARRLFVRLLGIAVTLDCYPKNSRHLGGFWQPSQASPNLSLVNTRARPVSRNRSGAPPPRDVE